MSFGGIPKRPVMPETPMKAGTATPQREAPSGDEDLRVKEEECNQGGRVELCSGSEGRPALGRPVAENVAHVRAFLWKLGPVACVSETISCSSRNRVHTIPHVRALTAHSDDCLSKARLSVITRMHRRWVS